MSKKRHRPQKPKEKRIKEPQNVVKVSPTEEVGATGLLQFGGYMAEEQMRQLQSTSRRIQVFKEMSTNDSTIAAILFTIDMLMRQVPWNAEPASQDNDAIEAADWLESNLHDMSQSWEDTLSEIMSFLPWGWSWHEVVLKIRNGPNRKEPGKGSKFNDGKWGWRKLPIRGQDSLFRWKFDDQGGVKALIQLPAPDYIERTVPIEKSLLFRTSIYKNNPEGESLLRKMYVSWYRKKRIEEIESIGLERDLVGLAVMYVPSKWTEPGSAQSALYTEAKQMVSNIKTDEQQGVVLPSLFDGEGNRELELSLLNSGGKRTFDTDKIIQRYNVQLAMTALADFLFLGHEKVGSFALASNKTNLFSVALGTWLDMIAAVFNRHAIPRLWDINGFPQETMPTLNHGDLEKDDPIVLGLFIERLTKSGLDFTDPETQNQLRRIAGLPERDEEDFLDIDPQEGIMEAVEQMAKDVRKATNGN